MFQNRLELEMVDGNSDSVFSRLCHIVESLNPLWLSLTIDCSQIASSGWVTWCHMYSRARKNIKLLGSKESCLSLITSLGLRFQRWFLTHSARVRPHLVRFLQTASEFPDELTSPPLLLIGWTGFEGATVDEVPGLESSSCHFGQTWQRLWNQSERCFLRWICICLRRVAFNIYMHHVHPSSFHVPKTRIEGYIRDPQRPKFDDTRTGLVCSLIQQRLFAKLFSDKKLFWDRCLSLLDALVGKTQASTSQKSAMQGLRKRQAAASEAAAKAKPTSSFGAYLSPLEIGDGDSCCLRLQYSHNVCTERSPGKRGSQLHFDWKTLGISLIL